MASRQLNLSPGLLQLDKDASLDTGLMSSERLDLVPSIYTYAIKACLLPIRKVQHELVTLYFQYIHPMFPVVDESYFMEIHRKYRGHEQFMDPKDFVVYQAITAAGFGASGPLPYLSIPSDDSNAILSISVKFSYSEHHTELSMKGKRLSLIKLRCVVFLRLLWQTLTHFEGPILVPAHKRSLCSHPDMSHHQPLEPRTCGGSEQ